jgi:hypothetical protein
VGIRRDERSSSGQVQCEISKTQSFSLFPRE